MEPGLSRLIREYNEAVADAVEALFSFWGLDTPKSGMEWACTDIRPQRGILPGGVSYFKHGFGCEVKLPGRPIVDFDFGEHGEIGLSTGFLYQYMCDADLDVGIESHEALRDLIEEALDKGDLVRSDLYFLPR